MEPGSTATLFDLCHRSDLDRKEVVVQSWDPIAKTYEVLVSSSQEKLSVSPSHLGPNNPAEFAAVQQLLSHELSIFSNHYTNVQSLLYDACLKTVTYRNALSGTCFVEIEEESFLLRIFPDQTAHEPCAQLLPLTYKPSVSTFFNVDSRNRRTELVVSDDATFDCFQLSIADEEIGLFYENRYPIFHLGVAHMEKLISNAYVEHVVSNTLELITFFRNNAEAPTYDPTDNFMIFSHGEHETTKVVSFDQPPNMFKVARACPSTRHKLRSLKSIDSYKRQENIEPVVVFPLDSNVIVDGRTVRVLRRLDYPEGGGYALSNTAHVKSEVITQHPRDFLYTQLVLSTHFLEFCESRFRTENPVAYAMDLEPEWLKTHQTLIMTIYGMLSLSEVEDDIRSSSMRLIHKNMPFRGNYLLSFQLMNLIYSIPEEYTAYLANLEALACAFTMLLEKDAHFTMESTHVLLGRIHTHYIRVFSFSAEPMAMLRRVFDVEASLPPDITVAVKLVSTMQNMSKSKHNSQTKPHMVSTKPHTVSTFNLADTTDWEDGGKTFEEKEAAARDVGDKLILEEKKEKEKEEKKRKPRKRKPKQKQPAPAQQVSVVSETKTRIPKDDGDTLSVVPTAVGDSVIGASLSDEEGSNFLNDSISIGVQTEEIMRSKSTAGSPHTVMVDEDGFRQAGSRSARNTTAKISSLQREIADLTDSLMELRVSNALMQTERDEFAKQQRREIENTKREADLKIRAAEDAHTAAQEKTKEAEDSLTKAQHDAAIATEKMIFAEASLKNARGSMMLLLFNQLLWYVDNEPFKCVAPRTLSIPFIISNAPAAMNIVKSVGYLDATRNETYVSILNALSDFFPEKCAHDDTSERLVFHS